jgi:hypothetical protein
VSDTPAPIFNPRDLIRVKGHDDELAVYTVSRSRTPHICVIVDGEQKWFRPDDVTEHHPAEPIAWNVGDRFALRSGDGQVVRHGTLLEWREREQHWFLRVGAEPHPTAGYEMDGFETWLPGTFIVPVEV